MPIPKPNPDEQESDFVSRCVEAIGGEYEDADQALAVCHAQFREGKSVQQVMLAAVKAGRPGEEFGYGITTADKYVAWIAGEIQAGRLSGKSLNLGYGGINSLMKRAEHTLAYCGKDQKQDKIETGMAAMRKLLGANPPEHSMMAIVHTLTTPSEDRDGDTLQTAGAKVDPKMPFLWQHVHTLPIGKMVRVVEHSKDILKVATVLLDLNELTSDVAKLFEAEALRFSHGFIPTNFEERKGGPTARFNVLEYEVVEESGVSVPSNRDAEVELFSRGKLESDLIKSHAKSLFDARTKSMPVTAQAKEAVGQSFVERLAREAADKQRAHAEKTLISRTPPQAINVDEKQLKAGLNKSSSVIRKMFDVATERLEPSTMEYDWAARFIGCSVKQLHVHTTSASGLMVGAFLEGLEHACAAKSCIETRNLSGEQEQPPVYETRDIDSKRRKTFLIEGIRFWASPEAKIVTRTWQGWGSQHLVVYADDCDQAQEVIDDAWAWVEANNPLKGQAFALTGGFIPRTGYEWQDVFLEKGIEDALKRTVRIINEKGIDAANRGIVMMGGPGTGKTLSCRVMMNETACTFIWVSPKDFYRGGGFMDAFSLARSLAPSILMFEDIDNWMTDYAIDLIKTEMDGLKQSSGVTTILTTNFPDQLPAALIDRPGRFHDVLEIHLPTREVRLRMLQKWAMFGQEGGATLDSLAAMAEQTDGYSGAHVYELCHFAKVIRDEEECSLDDALTKAFAKVKDQRDLINQNQLAGSSYRPGRRELSSAITKGFVMSKAIEQKLDDSMSMIGPIPHEGEAQAEFMDRCHLDPAMIGDYPTEADRRTACASLWSSKDGMPKSIKPAVKEMGTCKGCKETLPLDADGYCKDCAKAKDEPPKEEPEEGKGGKGKRRTQTKAGRVLSRKNEDTLNEAMQALDQGVAKIKSVLEQASPPPDEAADPAAGMSADFVLQRALLICCDDFDARDRFRKALDALDAGDKAEQLADDFRLLTSSG